MVSDRSVGSVASPLHINPRTPGSAVKISAEELAGEQMASKIAEHLNVTTQYREIPLNSLADDADQSAMWRWFTQISAYRADFIHTRELTGYNDEPVYLVDTIEAGLGRSTWRRIERYERKRRSTHIGRQR